MASFAVHFHANREGNCFAATTSGFFLLSLVTSLNTFYQAKQFSSFVFVEVDCKTVDNSSVAFLNTRSLEKRNNIHICLGE